MFFIPLLISSICFVFSNIFTEFMEKIFYVSMVFFLLCCMNSCKLLRKKKSKLSLLPLYVIVICYNTL